MKSTRRAFIKRAATAGVGMSFYLASGKLLAFSPNETVNVAMLGCGGRSYALNEAISLCKNVRLAFACDADKNRQEQFISKASETLGYRPEGESDFRKILESKDVDAVFISTPEHWHAPMAIMAMQAGKDVYVEKPCSHNLWENDLLVKVYEKTGRVCQMGNQQRSAATSIQGVKDIKAGLIGDVYYCKAWYSNTRGSIGTGQRVAVPDYLDWDLWQGPAPREDYRDNVHPYNWHWFKTWGTGEIHNNGTHEIDICRWAMDVDFPKRVISSGGRLHFRNDDWEFYDTQIASFEFDDNRTIVWEGRSCNGQPQWNRGRGAMIHGTEGTILLDRAGYTLFDLKGNEKSHTSEKEVGSSVDTSDTSGFDTLTVAHIDNFLDAIRENKPLNAPIDDASISTHLCHLGNIAQELEVSLDIDPSNGKIEGNKAASDMWSREYEKGWKPKL